MKKNLFMYLMTAALFTCCCNPLRNESVKDFIPGIYVREIHQDYSFGTDTLVITAIGDKPGSIYSILKKSRFQRKLNGRILSPENHTEIWVGIYDGKSGQLNDQKYGRVFSFDPDNQRLFLGSSEFKKVP